MTILADYLMLIWNASVLVLMVWLPVALIVVGLFLCLAGNNPPRR